MACSKLILVPSAKLVMCLGRWKTLAANPASLEFPATEVGEGCFYALPLRHMQRRNDPHHQPGDERQPQREQQRLAVDRWDGARGPHLCVNRKRPLAFTGPGEVGWEL